MDVDVVNPLKPTNILLGALKCTSIPHASTNVYRISAVSDVLQDISKIFDIASKDISGCQLKELFNISLSVFQFGFQHESFLAHCALPSKFDKNLVFSVLYRYYDSKEIQYNNFIM